MADYKITDIIKGKVKFDIASDGAILDEEDNHISDARGWGRFGTDQTACDKLNYLANFIADAINLKLEIDSNNRGVVFIGENEKSLAREVLALKTYHQNIPEVITDHRKSGSKRKKNHFTRRFNK